jgi:hypothetical protein
MVGIEITFLALQTIVALFLLLHDWMPDEKQ